MQAQTDTVQKFPSSCQIQMTDSGDPKIPEKNQDESEANASYISLKWETTNHSTFDGKPKLWNIIWFLEDRIHHPSIANNPAGLLGLSSRMGGTEDQNWAEMVQNHGQLLCITNTSSSGAGVSHFLPFKSLPYIYMYTCYYCSIV